MSKLIKFIPHVVNDEDLPYAKVPIPSSNFMPDWWKKQKLELFTDKISFNNLSFKACVPFLDSLISGYMIYTDQDIVVTLDSGVPLLTWQGSPEPLLFRPEHQELPIPEGHSSSHFAWRINFGIELPKGYSVLITHPLNRFDLPFTTVSGIIDQGVPWGGNFTFWIKNNFEGIIPKGTPFAQIIPFKTENWKSEKSDNLSEYAKKMHHEKLTIFSGYYKKFIHRKKKFE
jgi:hypothetical protein